LEFFCGARFYKDTAPTALKEKSRPGFPQRLWYYSRQFIFLHHRAENRVNTKDRPLYAACRENSGLVDRLTCREH